MTSQLDLTCSLCPKQGYSPPYTSLEKLEIHMVGNHCEVIEALSIYKCVPCVATLSTEITQLRHFSDRHNGGQSEQDKNVNLTRLKIYESINESVMNPCKIPQIGLCCRQCSDRSRFAQSFSSLEQLEMHIVAEHYNGLYLHKCWICQLWFPTQSFMLDHCKTEHLEALNGKSLLKLVLAKIKILHDLDYSVFMSISASREQNIEVIVLDNDDIFPVKQEPKLVAINTTCTSPSLFSNATTVEAPITYPSAVVYTTELELPSKPTVLSITENNAEAQSVEIPAASRYRKTANIKSFKIQDILDLASSSPPEVSPEVAPRAKEYVPGVSKATKDARQNRTHEECSMPVDENKTPTADTSFRPRREPKCPEYYGGFILGEPQLDYYIKMEPKKKRSHLIKSGQKELTTKTVLNSNGKRKRGRPVEINGEVNLTLCPVTGSNYNVKRKGRPAKLSMQKKPTQESETSRKFCQRRKEHIPAEELVITIAKETMEMIEQKLSTEMAMQENGAPPASQHWDVLLDIPVNMPNKRHFF